jgi:hypothetical protein
MMKKALGILAILVAACHLPAAADTCDGSKALSLTMESRAIYNDGNSLHASTLALAAAQEQKKCFLDDSLPLRTRMAFALGSANNFAFAANAEENIGSYDKAKDLALTALHVYKAIAAQRSFPDFQAEAQAAIDAAK